MYDPLFPTNTWRLRGNVDLDFPTNFSLPPGGICLAVNFAPTNTIALNSFKSKFNVPAGVPIFGPYGNKLDNGSGDIEIKRPDPPQTFPHEDVGFVPYILVESVEYDDDPPWPRQC